MIVNLIFKYKALLFTGIFCLMVCDFFNMAAPYILGEVVDRLRTEEQQSTPPPATDPFSGVTGEPQETLPSSTEQTTWSVTDPLKSMLLCFINDEDPLQHQLLYYAILLIIVSIIIGVFRFTYRFCIFGNATRIEKDVRETLFTHLQSLSSTFFNQNKVGDLMAHATNDLSAMIRALGFGVILLVDVVIGCLLYVTMLFWLNLELALYSILPFPFIILVVIFGGRLIRNRFNSLQDRFGKLTAKITENLMNIRIIKAYVQEDAEINNISNQSKGYLDQALRTVRISAGFDSTIWLLYSIGIAIVMVVGGMKVYYNTLTLGTYIKFLSFMGMVMWVFMALGMGINLYQRAKASYLRILEILHIKPEISNPPNPIILQELKGKISFNHVSFTYPGTDPKVLMDIDLRIQPNQLIALFGPTGSGKSTLIQLLARVYDATHGSITLDGINVQHLDLRFLRHRIAYVPQEAFLFSATVADNIRFVNPHISLEEVVQAAQIACVHENIQEFPDQYETIIGERGITLSGGQKQRVALARAIITKPDILILDDSFSAVDTETEEHILINLRKILNHRTTILISHRVSTVNGCDMIFVLDQGKLVEKGTHAALLQNEGPYYQTFMKQTTEETHFEPI